MSTAPRLQLVPAQAPEQWISRQRVLEITGWSLQWLSGQVRGGKVRMRETAIKLANGRFDVEYAVTSLPDDAQAKLQLAHAPQVAMAAPQGQQSLALFAPAAVPPSAPRVALSKAAETDMNERMRILQPVLDFRQQPSRYKALKLRNGKPVKTQRDMVAFTAEQHGVSERTVWRMLDRHAQGGANELVKRKRKDANQSKWYAEHPDAAALVASLYLGDGFIPGVSIQSCHQALFQQLALLGMGAADMPTYSTTRRFLMQAPASLVTYARKGKKKFGETILPYVTRGYTEHANQIWVSDHAIMDIEVVNDVFHGEAKLPIGKAFRLRLSCVIDYRSRMVVGYSWAAEESSTSIGAAIRNAVLQHGPADHMYVDNGKGYIKAAKGAQPGWLQQSGPDGWWLEEMERMDMQLGLMARLGMKVTHCIPHHPQSKHVERFFRTMHAQFCALFPTYTGGSPDRRPDATTALMTVHRKAEKRGDLEASMHPAASLVMAAFTAWLEQYHQTPHSGAGMKGRTPAQCFADERNPAQRPTPSIDELAVLFYDRVARKVDSCAITLANRRYVATEAVGVARMAARTGSTVTVAFNRSTPEQVAVLDGDGRLLCLLDQDVPLAFAPDAPETKAAIANSMQQRGHLTRSVREAHQGITRRARALGVASNLELLAHKVLPGSVAQDHITQPKPSRKTPAKTAAPLYSHDVARQIAAMED